MSAADVRALVEKAPVIVAFDARPGSDAEGEPAPDDRPPLKDFALLTSADLRAMPPMSWLVQGILPKRGIAGIYGAWGCGKGFFIMHLVDALSAGDRRFFGYRVPSTAKVTYVVLEGEGGVPKRVAALEQERGYNLPDSVRFVFESFKLTDRNDVLSLAASIEQAGGTDVTIIDTLNRAAPGSDENSSADMGRLIEAVKELQMLVGGLVIVVHHSGKEAGKGMRGHSSLPAAVDAAIEITRDGDLRTWRADKEKDEKDGQGHRFRLRVVELGTDEP